MESLIPVVTCKYIKNTKSLTKNLTPRQIQKVQSINKWRVPHVELDLLTLSEHQGSIPFFGKVRFASALVFYVVSCVILFVCLFVLFLCYSWRCQFIFDLWVWLPLWYISSFFYQSTKHVKNCHIPDLVHVFKTKWWVLPGFIVS